MNHSTDTRLRDLVLHELGREQRRETGRFADYFCSLWGDPIVPREGESAAVAIVCPKTAALCFDRVWGIGGSVPDSIRFGGATDFEVDTFGRILLMWGLNLVAGEIPEAREDRDRLCDQFVKEYARSAPRGMQFSDAYTRMLSDRLNDSLGLTTIPVYDSAATRDAQHAKGRREVVVSTLLNLEIVDEEHVSWKAVQQFRQDGEAREKYRRLAHWLDEEMVGKPQSYVQDAIAIRLDDYRWALKKHGIQTILGTLSAALDPKALASCAGAVASAVLAGFAEWSVVAGASVALGRVAVQVGKTTLEFQDLKRRTAPEVAYVYEAQRKLGSER